MRYALAALGGFLATVVLSACRFEPSITPIAWPTAPSTPDIRFGTPRLSTAPVDLPTTASTSVYEPGTREARVQEAIDAGDYQRAIDLTIELYGVDISNAPGVPTYNPNMYSGYFGTTDPRDGSIELGRAAFESPGTLATTLGHEAVHSTQIAQGRAYLIVDEAGDIDTFDEQGWHLNELEAWMWELEHAEQNGLSEDQIQEIQREVDIIYDELTEENRSLADAGIYALPTPQPETP
jgi:hypothetical protein